jgi:hypothetical protein
MHPTLQQKGQQTENFSEMLSLLLTAKCYEMLSVFSVFPSFDYR